MAPARGNVFVALPVSCPAKLWRSIQDKAPPFLRWFHRDDLHLTLAFLGPEVPELLPELHAMVAEIPSAEFEATLDSLRLLPSPRKCRALSFTLDRGNETAADLIDAWRNPLLEAAQRRPDDRPPLPHLTVARPDRQHPDYRTSKLLHWTNHLDLPECSVQVHAPALYGWSLERPRRQFRILAP